MHQEYTLACMYSTRVHGRGGLKQLGPMAAIQLEVALK